MMYLVVICLNFIQAFLSESKNFKTVFAVVLARKRDKVCFLIRLHPKARASSNLERDFHVIIFEFFFSEMGLKRFGVLKLKEFLEEDILIGKLHDFRNGLIVF